jgi:hypothetical protein
LCPGIKTGDKVAIELDGDLTVNSIIPPEPGFWCWWGIYDIDGGEHRMTFKDENNGASGSAGNLIRTPGAPEDTDVGPDFIMSTGEDWTAIGYTDPDVGLGFTGGWRILCKNSANTNGLSTVGGPGIPARFDLTHSPLFLYHFDRNLNDSSGNGFTLSGAVTYNQIAPNLFAAGGSVDATRAFDASLAITGDLTIQVLGKFYATPSNMRFVSFTAAGETLATNTLYQCGFNNSTTLRWLHERGVTGIDEEALITNSPQAIPDQREFFHLCFVRASGVITAYVNGTQWGSPSAALTAPDGGTSCSFVVPFSSGTFNLIGLKGITFGLSAAQVKAEYNRTMGVAFGTLA